MATRQNSVNILSLFVFVNDSIPLKKENPPFSWHMLDQMDEYQEDINERSRAMLMTSMNKAFVFKSDCSIFIDNLLLYAHVVCIKQT